MIPLNELRAHLRLDDTVDDALLEDYERAAVDYVERLTGRRWGAAGEVVQIERWSGGAVMLNDEPQGAVTVEESADGVTWATLSDVVFAGRLAYLPRYPVAPRFLRLTYPAGYGADAPETIKQAVRLLVGHWYENRESVIVGRTSKEIEHTVSALVRVTA